MSTTIDNRGMHETPLSRPLRDTRTQLEKDLLDVTDLALMELHARGHTEIKTLEAWAWRDVKTLLADVRAMRLPKVSG